MRGRAMSDSVRAGGAVRGPAVRGEELRRSYRGRVVVDVPEIEVPAGETYALLGTSGAGKSTLLRMLGLLERPDVGRIRYDGRTVTARDPAARREVAAVFQKPYLLRGTVAENVEYGLRLRGVPKRDRAPRVAEALERVGLPGWESRGALTLSGGEAQRVALARALVLRPRLMLLDEPLSYLDPLIKSQLTHEFARILGQASVTAVYVTHDQDEALVVADRVGIMHQGRIVQSGTVEEVMSLPADPWVAAFLGTEPLVEGKVTAVADGIATIVASGTPVYAASDGQPGTRVAFGVRPEDVLLFEPDVELPASSARNRLPAVVATVSPRGSTYYVGLNVGGFRVGSTVSRAAVRELGLEPGARVLAVFKATAVRVREGGMDVAVDRGPMAPSGDILRTEGR